MILKYRYIFFDPKSTTLYYPNMKSVKPASFNVEKRLQMWMPINRIAGDNMQIGENIHLPFAVRMPTKNGQAAVGMFAHDLNQDIPHRFAR